MGNKYLDRNWLYNEYVVKGRTLSSIARQFGVSREAVSFVSRKRGLKEERNKIHKPYMNREWLENEYVRKRRTQDDIAKECGVSRGIIGKWVRKHGLRKPTLTRDEVNAKRRERYKNDAQYRARRAEISRRWRNKNIDRCRQKSREYYYRTRGGR